MDRYALYTYNFIDAKVIEPNLFREGQEKVPASTADKNLWLDRLFGAKKSDVKIQKLKNGKGADKYPCTVLAHLDRVVWLRLENERLQKRYVKHASKSSEPDTIEIVNESTNPYSFIFIDCREDKNMIAIKEDSDAWRNTDTEAKLLEASLNDMMKDKGFGFCIEINPETMPKDFWDYNKRLIKKDNRRVRKMSIYFTSGSIDPRITALIDKTPLLKHLLKESWSAIKGKVDLYDPFGPQIVDGRKRDIKNIIEIIMSNALNQNFGLSLLYDNGIEVTCGKDIRIEYPMQANMMDMLFSKNLFGEYEINKWLDQAVKYIKEQKYGTTTKKDRKRKTPKHVQDTSTELSFL